MAQPHEIYLSPKVAEVLTTLVTQGRAQRVMTMSYILIEREGSVSNDYHLLIGKRTFPVAGIEEDPLFALAGLGLISHDRKQAKLFLTQAGVDWVNYHQQKWPARTGHWLWETSQGGVKALLTGVTAALAVIQLLKYLGLL